MKTVETTYMRMVATLALTAVLFFVPTNADAATSVSVPANLQPRAKALCNRVPNLLMRVDNQMTRLPAGPDTVGSIAWVKEKAQQAQARNRKQAAQELNNRADVLTQKLALLPNQKAALQKVQDTCVSLGFTT